MKVDDCANEGRRLMVLSPIYKGTLTQSFKLQENQLSETYGNLQFALQEEKIYGECGVRFKNCHLLKVMCI